MLCAALSDWWIFPCGVISAFGARLIRDADALLNMFDELRCTVEGLPISARLFPEDERWKAGCGGLFGASDMREEEIDLAWPDVAGIFSLIFEMELDLFNAEAG